MKEQIRVLVSCIGGSTGIGVIKCLKEKKDIYLIGMDAKVNNPSKNRCDKFIQTQKVKEDGYKNQIYSIIDKYNVDVFIPTMQDEIEIFISDKEYKNRIALPKTNNIPCMLNKGDLYSFMGKKFNAFIPKFCLFESNKDLLRIYENIFLNDETFCIKKVAGHGGIGFCIVSNDDNTIINGLKNNQRILRINDLMMIEDNYSKMAVETLHGKEYSVDVLVLDKKVVCCIPRLRSRVSTGIVIEGVVEKNDYLIEAASKLAIDLIDEGFINLQYIGNDNSYKLIDLNARFCGSQVHSFGAGVNIPYLLVNYMVNKKVDSINIKWGTKMVRYWESVFFND